MKLPNSIQVGGHIYKVEYLDCYSVDGDNDQGLHDYAIQTMKVATKTMTGESRAKSSIETTLWHEIIHAISYIYRADLEERQVSTIAQGIYQVYKQLE